MKMQFHVAGTVTVLAFSWSLSASPAPVLETAGSVSAGVATRTTGPLVERLPLLFVSEQAPSGGATAFSVRGRDVSVWLADGGMSYRLHPRDPVSPTPATDSWVVALDLVGAARRPPVGGDTLATRVSYFKGPRSNWRTGLPAYASVIYNEPWPGVTMIVSGRTGTLKSTFVVRPGANPSAIRFSYRGADSMRLDRDGTLVVTTPVGDLREEAPVAYQTINGKRVDVEAAFELESAPDQGHYSYRFRLGDFDPGFELVVDPVTIVYSGYVGGWGLDYGDDIAVDAEGNAYITGYTTSAENSFPVTVGPDTTYNGGDGDVFVAKVNAAGTDLVYCGFIGGSDEDHGGFLAVDAAGSAFVGGYTWSSEASFPVWIGPDLTYNGNGDGFLAKVNPSGTALDFCGYLGGSAEDEIYGVAVDAGGNAYVSGTTLSSEATFPVSVGPDLTYNGNGDAFVAKIDTNGSTILYAGYIGGAQADFGYGIDVTAAGTVFVTGSTDSDQSTFPVSVGPDLSYNGSRDAFVARVNTNGSVIDYCGYIGGSQFDLGWDVAADRVGNAYVTGETSSSELTFPVVVGPDLSFNGARDAFISKINAGGTAFTYSGYIGGSEDDAGYDIAVGPDLAVHVSGQTESTEATFPVAVGPDLSFNGGVLDAFVAMVSPVGGGLTYCSYIGGSADESGYGVDIGTNRDVYVTGRTQSSEATFPAVIGPDPTFNGGFTDGFVARLSLIDLFVFADGFESGDTSSWTISQP